VGESCKAMFIPFEEGEKKGRTILGKVRACPSPSICGTFV
jgi:hypothetical protein